MKPYLQYLVILLDDTSVAYCHADNPLRERRLIPLDILRQAIRFGMKQNLMIQYVYPDYDLPEAYNDLIESIDHVKIGRDVAVYTSVPARIESSNTVLRLTVRQLIDNQYDIAALLPQVERLNICLTDIETFRDDDIPAYRQALATLRSVLVNRYAAGATPQVNILTDRLILSELHDCGAGITNITLAPNGKFYLCPAFYYDEQTGVSNRMNHAHKDCSRSVGDLETGINIPNRQLLQVDHAPLCRRCDAYHCHRCIYLNQRLTWDNNTPSRQQCVLAHLERNAARDFQQALAARGLPAGEPIPELDYLDPFDVRKEY